MKGTSSKKDEAKKQPKNPEGMKKAPPQKPTPKNQDPKVKVPAKAGDKPVSSGEKEKYTLIIKNVETALPRIHEEQLVHHFRLNPERKRGATSGDGPSFEITVREETRNATIALRYDDQAEAQQLFKAPHSSLAESEKGKGQICKTGSDSVRLFGGQYYFGEKLNVRCVSGGVVGEESVAEATEASTDVLPTVNCSVSTDVVTTIAITPKHLSKILSDIPGFVNCWKRNLKQFRAIFNSKKALFLAKHLLDAFETDGVRVSVTVPDALTEEYNAFVESRAEAIA